MVITNPDLPDNPIVFCNEAFQRLTGYGRDEIVGQNCRFLQGPKTDKAAVAAVRQAIERAESIEIELLNYRKDGTQFWNALYLSPVRSLSGDVQFFFASQLDVTERVNAQAEIVKQKALVEKEVRRRTADLQAALETKTLLLHEVDHRVKNNLTMIGSLLRLQSRRIGDPALAAKLDSMLERIDALASVHRQLYRSTDLSRFDLAEFTHAIAGEMVGASGRSDIAVTAELEPILVDSTHASALGLVVNEIITNAIKHGFAAGQPGSIRISTSRNENAATLAIEDDGVGMKLGASGKGLGRTLVVRLSKQAGVDVQWKALPRGTRVELTFFD